MGKLLTAKEAALALRMSIRTLDRYVATGQIPRYKVGNRNLFEEIEIQKFLKRNRAS